MDDTNVKVKGHWKYLYRAVDKEGNPRYFLLAKRKQRISAQKFLIIAIKTIAIRPLFPYLIVPLWNVPKRFKSHINMYTSLGIFGQYVCQHRLKNGMSQKMLSKKIFNKPNAEYVGKL